MVGAAPPSIEAALIGDKRRGNSTPRRDRAGRSGAEEEGGVRGRSGRGEFEEDCLGDREEEEGF
jgi:hypothetical protein